MWSAYTQCGYLSKTTRQTIDKNNDRQIEKGSLLRKLIFALKTTGESLNSCVLKSMAYQLFPEGVPIKLKKKNFG